MLLALPELRLIVWREEASDTLKQLGRDCREQLCAPLRGIKVDQQLAGIAILSRRWHQPRDQALNDFRGECVDRRKTGFGKEREAIQFGEHLPKGLLDTTPHFGVALEILHEDEQARRFHTAGRACARPADDLHEAGAALAQSVRCAKSLDRMQQLSGKCRSRLPGCFGGRELLCRAVGQTQPP